MKIAVILFHSNIRNIYKQRWIDKCVNSLVNQTYNDFTFYEMNYGGDNYSILENITIKQDKKFWSSKKINCAEAMNFLMDQCFKDNCDYVFNTNLDDYYSLNRIELQLNMAIEGNFDILSSDFCYIQEEINNGSINDNIILFMDINKHGDIKHNLESSHNMIANPSVCYSKKFLADSENRHDYKKVPQEDFDLWIRSIKKGYKFGIHKDVLLYYRRHENQSSVKV